MTILERLLAANTLVHLPRCGGWYRLKRPTDSGYMVRGDGVEYVFDRNCTRAATHKLVDKVGVLSTGGMFEETLRCEGHADSCLLKECAEPLPQRSQVLELEQIAWSSKP